jgi:hypothetical protein
LAASRSWCRLPFYLTMIRRLCLREKKLTDKQTFNPGVQYCRATTQFLSVPVERKVLHGNRILTY